MTRFGLMLLPAFLVLPFLIRAATSGEAVFFRDSLNRAATPIVWGGTSTARIVSSTNPGAGGSVRIQLDTPGAYSGVMFQLSGTADLGRDHRKKFLTFRIRGSRGGEKLGVHLSDSFIGGDDFDLNAGVRLDDYTAVTTNWQTVSIPLADFPPEGVNWTRPPTDRLPHTGPFDWRHLESVMFLLQGVSADLWLDDIVITPAAKSGRAPGLVSGFPSDLGRFDLAAVPEIRVTSELDRICEWGIRITGTSSGAVKRFKAVSSKPTIRWDGSADQGRFRAEKCRVSLDAVDLAGVRLRPSACGNLVLTRIHSRAIKVNQTGYLPDAPKRAYLSDPASAGKKARIIDAATGAVAWSGFVGPRAIADRPSAEKVVSVDFTELTNPGMFLLEVDGVGDSYIFRIGAEIYAKVFTDSARAFYYQRCGTELSAGYAGRWTHKACHLADAEVHPAAASAAVPAGTRIRSLGGWHDAGDFGKKVVPAATALAHLLWFYELFPAKASIRLGIPNPVRGQPDLLAEARYELEWMITMQRKDGAVYHLITSPEFAGPGVMPEEDGQSRFITPVTSCATADFAAVMALSARIYRPFDPAFAAICLSAAERAWKRLAEEPAIFPAGGYKDPAGIHATGGYEDASDREERFWAACELYTTTGGQEYKRYAEERAAGWNPVIDYPAAWTDPHEWGMLSYLLCGRGEADKTLQDRIRAEFVAYGERILRKARANGYPAVLSEEQYYWGSNSVIMGYSCDLIIAFALTGRKEFRDAALSQLDAILGCNTLDLSFVTGTGTRSVRDPWQAASAWDRNDDPVPGFLPGGPNKYLNDPIVREAQKKFELAPAACFVDSHNAPSSSEVCLPYNSPLVFAAGFFSP